MSVDHRSEITQLLSHTESHTGVSVTCVVVPVVRRRGRRKAWKWVEICCVVSCMRTQGRLVFAELHEHFSSIGYKRDALVIMKSALSHLFYFLMIRDIIPKKLAT